MTVPVVIGPVKVAVAWYVEAGAAAPAADGPKEPPPAVPRTTAAINPANAVTVRVMCMLHADLHPPGTTLPVRSCPGSCRCRQDPTCGDFSCYISPSGKKLTQLLCMDAPSAMIVEPLT